MSEITLYHNPRCSKSRMALKYLDEKNKSYEVVDYQDGSLTAEELSDVLSKLSMSPKELIRKGEAIYKELFKNAQLTDKEWVDAMINYPKLIERPIVILGQKAVVARPTEKISEIL